MSSSQNKRRDWNAEEAKTQRKTSTAASSWFLVDPRGYPDGESSGTNDGHADVDDAGHPVWAASAVTSLGATFQVSVRAKEPPDVTRLVFKADVPADILESYTQPAWFSPPPRCAEVGVIPRHGRPPRDLVPQQGLLRDGPYQQPLLASRPDWPPGNYAAYASPRRAMATWWRRWNERPRRGTSTSSRRQATRSAVGRPASPPSSATPTVGARLRRQVLVAGPGPRAALLLLRYDSLLQEDDDGPVALEFTPLPNVTLDMAKNARSPRYPWWKTGASRPAAAACGTSRCACTATSRGRRRRGRRRRSATTAEAAPSRRGP